MPEETTIDNDFAGWLADVKLTASKASKGPWWVGSHGCTLSANGHWLVNFNHGGRESTRHKDTGNLSAWENDNDPSHISGMSPDNTSKFIRRYEDLNTAFLALAGRTEDGNIRLETPDSTIELSVEQGYVKVESITSK